MSAHRPGDVVNGHVLTPHHGWMPIIPVRSMEPVPVKATGTNHLLHLVITLVTFGLWIPVWIVIAMNDQGKQYAAQERRRLAVRVYRPGDVVNGHVLTEQNGWVPVTAPPSVPHLIAPMRPVGGDR